MKKLLFLLFCTGLGLPVAGQRWQIDPDGGIVWRPGNDTPHRDHLEMTGEQISTVLRWVVDDRGAFRVERSLIFPLLRVRPNDTHASLMCRVATDIPSLLAVNTSASGFNASALQFERVEKIVIDGTVRVFSQWSFNAVGAGYEEVEHPAPVLAMERTIFPSPTQPALCERYLIRNIGSQTLEISIPEFSQIVTTPSERGITGGYVIRAELLDAGIRILQPGDSTVVSARNGVNLANLQLKVLMGMESDVKVAVEGNLKDYEMSMFTRQAMPRPDNLTNNSTLKQLELNALQLKQTLKLQYTNFMPTLSASFQYMYTSMNDNFKFKEYDWRPYSTIGLNLSIPLFKGSNFTQLKQTRIQMKQLEENRINTERQLTMQATGYLDNMAASTEQVVSNKEAVFQAEKGRTIAEKRYEVGKGTILELNSSEVALTEAQLTYNQSIYDYLVAKADLDLVLGIDEVTEQ